MKGLAEGLELSRNPELAAGGFSPPSVRVQPGMFWELGNLHQGWSWVSLWPGLTSWETAGLD